MELLEEPTIRDRIDQLLAFCLTLVCVGLAASAVLQVRVVIALAGELADFRRSQFRLATAVGVIILGLAWFIYTMWVVDSHQQGYTLARIARAQGKLMPARFGHRTVMIWLWEHNLQPVDRTLSQECTGPTYCPAPRSGRRRGVAGAAASETLGTRLGPALC